jgi:hypothetical protein
MLYYIFSNLSHFHLFVNTNLETLWSFDLLTLWKIEFFRKCHNVFARMLMHLFLPSCGTLLKMCLPRTISCLMINVVFLDITPDNIRRSFWMLSCDCRVFCLICCTIFPSALTRLVELADKHHASEILWDTWIGATLVDESLALRLAVIPCSRWAALQLALSGRCLL